MKRISFLVLCGLAIALGGILLSYRFSRPPALAARQVHLPDGRRIDLVIAAYPGGVYAEFIEYCSDGTPGRYSRTLLTEDVDQARHAAEIKVDENLATFHAADKSLRFDLLND